MGRGGGGHSIYARTKQSLEKAGWGVGVHKIETPWLCFGDRPLVVFSQVGGKWDNGLLELHLCSSGSQEEGEGGGRESWEIVGTSHQRRLQWDIIHFKQCRMET